MQAKQASYASPGCVQREGPTNSPLVSVGNENLTQEGGVNESYVFKVYNEIAAVRRCLFEGGSHGREIVFGPGTGELQYLRASAPIGLQARFGELRHRRPVEGA